MQQSIIQTTVSDDSLTVGSGHTDTSASGGEVV